MKNMMMNLRSTPVLSTLTYETESPWSGLQQPVHATRIPADTLRVLSALDEGWQIVEVAHLLASGKNNEGDSYLLALMHPKRMQIQKLRVRANAQIKQLLETERVPMA
jgi:hypothetical protein